MKASRIKKDSLSALSASSATRMPVLFLGHGNPMNAIDENQFVEGFRNISREIPRPRSILCISAHWETRGTKVTAMEFPKTIHDFSGFPDALYNVIYPAPGNPELAIETRNIINPTGVELDYSWGLDHGTWSVLKHMYPEADIPVVQLSLDYNKPAANHYDLAKELSSLRNKGVLIIGSGNMIHNLGMVDWHRLNEIDFAYDWVSEAREKMIKFMLEDDHRSMINWEDNGTAFKLSIPTPEHYLPLLYILALKGKNEKIDIFNDKAVAGSLTMTSIMIDNP